MGSSQSAVQEKTDDLTCLWCNKPFTDPVTLGCGHRLCRACAARVREREKHPRCRYSDCGLEIRDTRYVVNRTLDKLVERAKILKNTPKDELGGDGGVEQNSITSSCSTDSMDRPPYMSPAGTPESGLLSSKTAGTCDDRERCESVNTQHEGSVHTANGPFDKENTEARGSVPVSSSFSDGDSRFKETLSEGNDLCSDTTMYGPPDMALPPAVEIGSDFSEDLSDVYSVGNSNPSLDELGGHSGVEGSSVGSLCSISSMKPPPHMSPAPTSELFSSKTGETSGAENSCVSVDSQSETSVRDSTELSSKGPTEARGSEAFPSNSSDGDNEFKETRSGGSASCTSSDPNLFKPPTLVLSRSLETGVHGDSGGEELKRSFPARTHRGHGCLI